MVFEMDPITTYRVKCELCGKIFTDATSDVASARALLHDEDTPKKGSHVFGQGEECFVFHPDSPETPRLIKVMIVACAFSEMHVPTYEVKAEFGEFTVFADQAYINGLLRPE